MNEASRWRFEIGQRLGMGYAANPKARVVMVAGSTGRGTADRYSDLEIDVYWSEPPSDDERRAAVAAGGGTLLTLYDYEEDEWAEEISFGGFHVGTSTFLVETMERYLHEVLEQYSTAENPQMRLSSVLHARTIVGDDLVAQWRARAGAYPTPLVHAMLQENLLFDGFGYGEWMFAARDDAIVLYNIFSRIGRQILGALLGLNRLYLPNPTFKSMDELIAEMVVRPPDLARRLKAAFHVPPLDGVRDLHALIEETFGLVESLHPDFDTTPYRQKVSHRRGEWDQPPDF
ncbi:MAG TPA: hypothetical protein VER55_16135 [Ardenticatenaceae bacterium]|nr:hypothetical protein [Ardenticatenaceae bacterium]